MKKSRAKSGYYGVSYKKVSKKYSKHRLFPAGYYFNLCINGVLKTWNKVFARAKDAALARDKVILEKGLKEPLQILKPKSNDKERRTGLESLDRDGNQDIDSKVQPGV